MPNKHQIQKDFYMRRNEWIRTLKDEEKKKNNTVKNEKNSKSINVKKISIGFDYEIDKNGPKSYLVDEDKYDFTPKKIDQDLDSNFDR